jgi:hypothetical protein
MTFDSVAVDVVAELEEDNGQYHGIEGNRRLVKQTVQTIGSITGAAEKVLDLPIGNAIRNLLMLVKDGSTVAFDNSLVTDYTLAEDDTTDLFKAVRFDISQAQDIEEKGFPSQTRVTGATMIDMDRNPGKEPYDTFGHASLKLKCNVGAPSSSANAQVRVIIEENVLRRRM